MSSSLERWQRAIEQRPELLKLCQPRLNRYIPHQPTPKQAAFLLLSIREAMFGGAAGGGKSGGLLMSALQYVDIPGYHAILFRRTFADLMLPGALIDMSQEWLASSDATWKAKEHYWQFPNGSTLGFGYLDGPNDRFRYQSAQFSFIGFDELTQFPETDYRYMFSRLRRPRCPKHSKPDEKCRVCIQYAPIQSVPLRIRAATNPGGSGHDWVKCRFVDYGNTAERVFIPAQIQDNPYLDAEAYRLSLTNLDPVTRRQLEKGDWTARQEGGFFITDKISVIDHAPANLVSKCRFWDLAATKPKRGNSDPDYTVGVLLGVDAEGLVYVIDVRRARGTPLEIQKLVRATAELDGVETQIGMEREGGASGATLIDHYQREVLRGFWFTPALATGKKELRARPFASYVQNGSVRVVRSKWNFDYLDELGAFPNGSHDDQVDASSGAFTMLTFNDDFQFLNSTLIMPEGELIEL